MDRFYNYVNKLFYSFSLILILISSCNSINTTEEKKRADIPKEILPSPLLPSTTKNNPTVPFGANPNEPERSFIVRLYSETETPINGSGVIVGRRKLDNQHFYYVLTAKHVIDNSSSKAFPISKLTTFDKNSHNITNIFKFPNIDIDLAIIEFSVTSVNNNYQYDLPFIRVKKLQNTNEDILVTVYGYRSCESRHSLDRMWESTVGKVLQSQSKDRLNYNANTVEGMSGAGVFIKENKNAQPLLVAIHTNGGMKKEYDTSTCSPLHKVLGKENYDINKPNFGVPMYLFLKEYQKLKDIPSDIEIKFEDNKVNWKKSP